MSSSAQAASRSDRPFRVLIVRTGAMGDVLHAMPAVAAMRRAHPEWRIGWAIEPRWRPLLEGNCGSTPTMPLVDRIHNVPTRSWNQRPFSQHTARSAWRLRQELRAERYDLCVDMQGLLRSAVVGWMAHAAEFVGAAAPREGAARWFYSRQIVTSAAHVIDRGCELLGGAIGEPLTAATVPLPVDAAAERWCDGLLGRLLPGGLDQGKLVEGGLGQGGSGQGGLSEGKLVAGKGYRRFAVLAPTAGWGAKRWPVERYGAVAAALAAAGYVPLVNAASEGDAVAAAVKLASGGCAVPVCCAVGELIALMRRASVVVAGDTGPLHLAAALRRPVVALFGPTDPARTGPYGGPEGLCGRVFRHASSKVDRRRYAGPEAGLARITVEEVTTAALGLAGGC